LSRTYNKMRNFPLRQLLALLPLLLALTGCSISKVMRVTDHKVISVDTMINEVKDTPLLFVGERHDTSAHHELQLEILKAKLRQGQQLAIGVEMFDDTSQPEVDAWVAGKTREESFRGTFERSWRNLPWDLYRDIFLFAQENRIPIIALNAPRQLVQQVAGSGMASLTPEQVAMLPEGVDSEVSDAYLDFIKSAYFIHGRNGDAFRFICEAQMLRNRVMARHITDYLSSHPGSAMVVIAGGGHARERGGVPAELRNISYKIILPPIPALTSDTVTKGDGDYLMEEPFFWIGEIL
jgi:uncharacterized iron-regulated protein